MSHFCLFKPARAAIAPQPQRQTPSAGPQLGLDAPCWNRGSGSSGWDGNPISPATPADHQQGGQANA